MSNLREQLLACMLLVAGCDDLPDSEAELDDAALGAPRIRITGGPEAVIDLDAPQWVKPNGERYKTFVGWDPWGAWIDAGPQFFRLTAADSRVRFFPGMSEWYELTFDRNVTPGSAQARPDYAFVSRRDPNPSHDNFRHWPVGAYAPGDGTVYVLAHSENYGFIANAGTKDGIVAYDDMPEGLTTGFSPFGWPTQEPTWAWYTALHLLKCSGVPLRCNFVYHPENVNTTDKAIAYPRPPVPPQYTVTNGVRDVGPWGWAIHKTGPQGEFARTWGVLQPSNLLLENDGYIYFAAEHLPSVHGQAPPFHRGGVILFRVRADLIGRFDNPATGNHYWELFTQARQWQTIPRYSYVDGTPGAPMKPYIFFQDLGDGLTGEAQWIAGGYGGQILKKVGTVTVMIGRDLRNGAPVFHWLSSLGTPMELTEPGHRGYVELAPGVDLNLGHELYQSALDPGDSDLSFRNLRENTRVYYTTSFDRHAVHRWPMELSNFPKTKCEIQQTSCAAFPQYAGTFQDSNSVANGSPDHCARRAREYSIWCLNGPAVTTTARYVVGTSVVRQGAYTPPYAPEVHDFATEFSGTQGQRGWFYRELTATGSRDMQLRADGWWHGSRPFTLIGRGSAHPDVDQPEIQWKVPATGYVRIAGDVGKADTTAGDGVDVSIVSNGVTIWGPTTLAFNNAQGFAFDLRRAVAAGDQIGFRTHQRASSAYDTTRWRPKLTFLRTP